MRLLPAMTIIAAFGGIFQNVLSGSESVNTGVHTAEDFATFFQDKVQSVRACTTTAPLHDVQFQGHDIFTH